MGPIVIALALAGLGIGYAASKKPGISSAKKQADLRIPSELYQRGIRATQTSDPAAVQSVVLAINKAIGQTWFAAQLAIVMGDLQHNTLPAAKSEVQASLATTDLVARVLANVKDAALLERYAGELQKYGLTVSANRLRDKARTYGSALPGLPPDLQAVVAHAQELNTAEAYSSAAYSLEQAGFPESAKVLRAKAAVLSVAKGAPPASQWPNQSTDPTMDPALAAEVARIMRDSADPKTLHDLGAKLRALGYSATADQLDAKAAQIESTHTAATAMQQISTVMTDFSIPSGTPGQPPTAAPSEVLAPKSPAALAAQNMVRALFTLLNKYTTIKAAKKAYTQAQGSVLAFQKLMGLGTDGLYGVKAALAAAQYVDMIPPVFYWPKAATKDTTAQYLAALETLADQAEANGDKMRATALHASIEDESTRGIGPGEPGYGK